MPPHKEIIVQALRGTSSFLAEPVISVSRLRQMCCLQLKGTARTTVRKAGNLAKDRLQGWEIQQRFDPPAIAQSAGLKNVQVGQVGQQKISDYRLAAVNAPQKSRDALGVSASNQRRIFFCGGGNFRRLAVLDQIKKTLAHRASLASVRDYLAIGLADRSSQHRLL